jgi:hypothetical protein
VLISAINGPPPAQSTIGRDPSLNSALLQSRFYSVQHPALAASSPQPLSPIPTCITTRSQQSCVLATTPEFVSQTAQLPQEHPPASPGFHSSRLVACLFPNASACLSGSWRRCWSALWTYTWTPRASRSNIYIYGPVGFFENLWLTLSSFQCSIPRHIPYPFTMIDRTVQTMANMGRGAYDTTGVPKPPPRPKPR